MRIYKTKIAAILFTVILFVCCNQKPSPKEENNTNKNEKAIMDKLTGEEFKIVVNFTFKPEYKNELISTLHKTIDATRQEPGCIYYDLHEDMNDSLKYTLLEYWETNADWEKHKETEHFKTYQKETEGKFESVDVKLIKQIY